MQLRTRFPFGEVWTLEIALFPRILLILSLIVKAWYSGRLQPDLVTRVMTFSLSMIGAVVDGAALLFEEVLA